MGQVRSLLLQVSKKASPPLCEILAMRLTLTLRLLPSKKLSGYSLFGSILKLLTRVLNVQRFKGEGKK